MSAALRQIDEQGNSFEKRFLDMQQRYLSSKKQHNEDIEKWRLEKVELRKANRKGGSGAATSSGGNTGVSRPSSAGINRSAGGTRPESASGVDRASSPLFGSTATNHAGTQPSPSRAQLTRRLSNTGSGPSPLAGRRNTASSPNNNATTNPPTPSKATTPGGGGVAPLDYVALSQAAGGNNPVGFTLEDNAMMWGIDTQRAEAVQMNALLQLNQQLRTQLEDSDNSVKLLRQEVNHQKAAQDTLRRQWEEQARDHHGVVRERDLAGQKNELAQATVAALKHEKAVKDEDSDRMNHQHSVHLRELRAKLELSFDKCEAITKELGARTNDVKEHVLTIAGLQGRLAVTESGLHTQKEANQSMLLEMQSLNTQLSHERRKLLGASREVQMAALSRDQATDAVKQLEQVRSEKAATENENLKLLNEVAKAHSIAGDRARSEVATQLEELRHGAAHWERVCQLQYKDIAERNDQHLQMRAEFDHAKAGRDEADLIVRTLQVELTMAEAKLELVWPSHRRDTRGLDADNLKDAFGRMKAQRATPNGLPPHMAAKFQSTHGTGNPNPTIEDLQDHVAELTELNTLLVAENESLRLTNEVLVGRVKDSHEMKTKQEEQWEAKNKKVQADTKRSLGKVEDQADRIRFLEAQVCSMRGVAVEPSISLRECSAEDTVVELFLGQVIMEERAPEKDSGAMPSHFCTLDFLLHEPVTTGVFVGGGGSTFLDTTFAFKISMDALLEHYLKNRGIDVQLHEILPTARPDGGNYNTIGEGSAMVTELLGVANVDSERPQIRGHIAIYAQGASNDASSTSVGLHGAQGSPARRRVASIEFVVTVRTPFSDSFRILIQNHGRTAHTGASVPSGGADASGANVSSVSSSLSVQSLSKTQLASRVSPAFLESLHGVKEVSIEVKKFCALYSLPKLPLLCIFAQLEKAAEWWIQPPTPQPKYEYDFAQAHSIPVAHQTDLFDVLRSSLALALWDVEDGSSESYWGLGVQPLQCVLDQELLSVNVTCGISSPRGELLGDVHVTITLSTQRSAVLHGTTNPQAAAFPEARRLHESSLNASAINRTGAQDVDDDVVEIESNEEPKPPSEVAAQVIAGGAPPTAGGSGAPQPPPSRPLSVASSVNSAVRGSNLVEGTPPPIPPSPKQPGVVGGRGLGASGTRTPPGPQTMRKASPPAPQGAKSQGPAPAPPPGPKQPAASLDQQMMAQALS